MCVRASKACLLPRERGKLLERITTANCAHAREGDASGTLSCAERTCIFPGGGPRRVVMLLSKRRGAEMSETDLGEALARHLNGELTEEKFAHLLRWLDDPPEAERAARDAEWAEWRKTHGVSSRVP